MKIDRLVLVDYKRFQLRQIRRLEYIPSKKTQVILGSNGSGKSSLMEELSPLPANNKDFERGGSKEVWLTHRGNSYYLASKFTEDGNQFIFELNGENLNHGLTVTGYRDLVKEHFNYTKELHSLFTGKTYFHAMSVNERRNWFMNLSDVDYDYAFAYFRRLKEKQRDLAGALKRTQERLSQEQAKLLTDNQKLALEVQSKQLTDEINRLIHIRPAQLSKDIDLAHLENRLSKTLTALDELCIGYQSDMTAPRLTSIEVMEAKCHEYSIAISAIDKELSLRYDNQTLLQKRLGEFQGIGDVSLVDVDKQISEIESTLTNLNLQMYPAIPPEEPQLVLEALNYSSDYLASLSQSLSELPERDFDREMYKTYRLSLETLKIGQAKLTEQVRQMTNFIQDHDEKKKQASTECPKCSHQWIPDYDAIKYAAAVKQRESVQAELERVGATLGAYEAKLKVYDSFLTSMQQFDRFLESASRLQPFLKKLRCADVMVKQPEVIPHRINAYRQELLMAIEQKQLEEKKVGLLKTKHLLESINQKDRASLELQLAKEDTEIGLRMLEKRNLQQQDTILKRHLGTLRTVAMLVTEATALQVERQRATKLVIVDYIRKAMDDAIHHASIQRSDIERQLSQIELQLRLVKGLEEEIAALKADTELLTVAITALSPASGLIAKGMTQFINSFLEDVNTFINRIWSYPLELAPVTPDGEDDLDLDYKFEIRVNGKKVSPDINETSQGMKEIINLAFVLVSMQYLNLEDYPVFLDEFAVKMDAAHRNAAYRIIDYLIESKDFSQLFLISHYENGYSNLNDAEMLVLCPANVVLPSHLKYNQHATME